MRISEYSMNFHTEFPNKILHENHCFMMFHAYAIHGIKLEARRQEQDEELRIRAEASRVRSSHLSRELP